MSPFSFPMVKIEFITDYVCPFCIVAKETLKRALEELQLEASVTYIPYELTREPSPRVDTFHDERRRAHYKILEEPTKELGLDLHFPPRVIPRPYSRLAFEGLLYAREHGKETAWNDRLYYAYFQDEEDIGDVEVLKNIAVSLGLDGGEFQKSLEEGWYRKEEAEKQENVRSVYSFRGVPTIFLDGNKVELNTYSLTEMKQILLSAVSTTGGMCCGEDGCH